MKLVPVAMLAALLLAAGCENPAGPATSDPSASEPAAPDASAPATDGPELAPAAFGPPNPGSIVMGRREDGTLEKTRVVGIDGFAVTVERAGERITRVPFCHACGHPREEPIEMARYEALWPLEVGKSVTFQRRRDRDGTIWVHTVEVTGTETIETELGPLATYVVRQEVRGTGRDRGRGTRTQWYAPQLDWPVRSEWSAPDGGAASWEIAAIALANPE